MSKKSRKRLLEKLAKMRFSVVCLECANMWSVLPDDYLWCPKCKGCRVVTERSIIKTKKKA